MRVVSCIILLGLFIVNVKGQVVFNEVMASNDDFTFDSNGEDLDWLELFNSSDTLVCLDNFYLTDDDKDLDRWSLKGLCLGASQYLVLWSYDEERGSQPKHFNFSLNAQGESIYLTDGDVIVDSLIFPPLATNESYGRVNDGKSIAHLLKPTPGEKNTLARYYGDRLIEFHSSSDNFLDSLSVKIIASDTCEFVSYNLEGRPSTDRNFKEGQEVHFHGSDKSDLSPYFALYPTSPEFKPSRDLNKLPYLTANCIVDGDRIISSRGKSYFDLTFFSKHYGLPILALDIKEDDLFNQDFGIMVKGQNSNFEKEGRDWERRGTLTVFDETHTKVHQTELGVRIHGHATRLLPQKSIKFYARTDYDSDTISGEFLDRENPLARFLVRSFHSEFVGNEFTDFGFRDDIVQNIVKDISSVSPQHSTPCVLFINNEFWGLYSWHETTDDDFFASLENTVPDNIEILEGASSVYEQFQKVKHLDLDEPLDRLQFERVFDLQNVVDYILIQTFFGNTDWPHNNVKMWRNRAENAVFKFAIFDLDATLKFSQDNYFSRFYSEKGLSNRFPEKHHAFYQYLLNSEFFVSQLKSRYAELRNNTLDIDHMLEVARNIHDEVRPYIREQSHRWHYPRSLNAWEESYKTIQQFLVTRHLHFVDHLASISPPSLFPNPNGHGVFNIRESDIEFYTSIEVYGINGQFLTEVKLLSNTLDLQEYSGVGMLVVKLKGPNGSKTEKLFLP